MDAVDNQGVEGRDRAARLAWRTEVVTAAVQKLGSEISEQVSWRHDPSEWQAWLSHAFDRSLIAASGLFDPIFYLSANRDVAQAKIDPLEHYLRYGGQEGRWPGPAFDSTVYLASHEASRRSGLNPLIHYLKYGLLEGHRDGVPEIHPPPVGAAADRGRSEPLPGLFALPASGQSAYAAVLALQAQHAALEAAVAGLRAAAGQGELSARQALEDELEALRAAVEWRDHQLLALQSDFTVTLSATRAREAEHEAETAALRGARDEAELKLYVANAALQRAATGNDRLSAALRASETEAAGLRAELAQRNAVGAQGFGHALEDERAAALSAARAREAEHEAETAALRGARDEAELKLYVANAALQRAVARNERLETARRTEPEVGPPQVEADRRGDARSALEEAAAAARAAASAAQAELAEARSELTATGRELALAARELMLTGRELHRLQGEESGHREARAERDALRLQMALLERDVQRGREGEAALIVSRAEAAALAERTRATEAALAALRAEAPSLAALADAVRAGLAARNGAVGATVVGQLADARERTGRLDRIEAEVTDTRLPALRRRYLDLLEAALAALRPADAAGSASRPRLEHLCRLVETALAERVEGDVIEAGGRPGEAAIYMRGILAAHGVTDRTVWVADALARPPGRTRRVRAEPDPGSGTVRDRFARLGLLDDQVAFLPGPFGRTLAKAPIRRIALLRIGEGPPGSAPEALATLYPSVAPGGFVVVGAEVGKACRAAIEAFRQQQTIEGAIVDADDASVFWRKAR